MRVFAKNPVLAKSKFWYHMKRQHKVRKVQGEVVSVQEVYEKHAGVVKNYGIVLRYLSRTDTINMYKEFRDTTLSGAVSQMCKYRVNQLLQLIPQLNHFPNHQSALDMEMSGRHRAPHESIQIIKTSIVEPNEVLREHTRAYSKVSVKFPKVNRIKRAPSKSLKTTFKASRPIVA
jgi:large subunit ribosomal protein L18Ae